MEEQNKPVYTIEELKDKLDDLLNDRITKEFELEFIEPDFMS